MSWPDILLRLFSVLGLIAINAFFVTAEFSLVSVRRSRINQLAEAGNPQAKTVQNLQENIDRLLSTTQLGITLSSLALGWIGENTMAVLMAIWLAELPLPEELRTALAHSLSVPVAFLAIAYLQIVLGELSPKSVALLYSERLALLLGPMSLTIARFFSPFIWILNQSTRWLLRFAGIRYTGGGWYSRVTPEELQMIIATERESTGLEAEERELLNNVFEFGDVSAGEVMVPRTSIRAIPSDATFGTLLEEVVATGHSRYPVMRESLDDIRGIVYFKKLARPLSEGILSLDSPILPWIRPARFVLESTPLSELLHLMQRSQRAMVMVVDEFGGTAGLVTISDLVAQIIGDSHEPEDPEGLTVQMLDDQSFDIQAQMNLEELNELLNLELPLTDEYQTLAGFILYQFQKIPAQGETLHYQNLEFKVHSADGPRLDRIRLRISRYPTSPDDEPDDEQSDPNNASTDNSSLTSATLEVSDSPSSEESDPDRAEDILPPNSASDSDLDLDADTRRNRE